MDVSHTDPGHFNMNPFTGFLSVYLEAVSGVDLSQDGSVRGLAHADAVCCTGSGSSCLPGRIIQHILVTDPANSDSGHFDMHPSSGNLAVYLKAVPPAKLPDHGAARLILEGESSGERLLKETLEILSDEALRRRMEANMAALGVPDANERIYDTVMELLRREK